MESTPSPSLRDRVTRLRGAYLAKLPRVLEEASQACTRLATDAGDEHILDALHRLFHNLKGTAASLGLPEISAESAIASNLVRAWQQYPPTARAQSIAAGLPRLLACIVRLRQLEQAELMLAPQPAVAPQPEAAVVPVEAVLDLRPRVVFLCDDQLDGDQLGAQLACFGYSVTSFNDAQQLKAAIAANPPDAMVVSIAGAELFAEVRAKAEIPMLFIAEQSDFATRLKAVQSGGEAYFLKPVAAHEMVETLDAVTTRREPEPFRVLIVDDEPEMADYHAMILEGSGMLVRRMSDPARLLEELGEFQPDLVLMDMYMPICSGRELSRVIRQIPQFVSLPIIFLSSETDKEVQVSAMRVGADGFLTKPILPEDLINAVVVRAERTRVLRSLMMRDSLTGLLNHTTLSQFLETSLAAAERHGVSLCFVMMDLDHFKRVNDNYGHPAGDQVLLALARILKQRLRGSDMIGRYGGEEFAAVLQGVSIIDAVRIIDQIREDFAALIFKAGDRTFSCSFSSGVAGFPDFASPEQIVQAADKALYASKSCGRNRVEAAHAPFKGMRA